MANVTALVKGREVDAGDGVYLERRDDREHAVEQWLRGMAAHVQAWLPQRSPWARTVRRCLELEPQMRAASDDQLRTLFREACAATRREGLSDALLARSFACVREASRRVLGMRHHDVQIMGGWTLLRGCVAEMATGEGKTLVAALAASAAAGTGVAVHVVTVNDYLAQRDAEQNAPLFAFLGLTVGTIEAEMEPQARRAQYACDITYVSNKELVFDYLKDRIATRGTLESHLRLKAWVQGQGALPVLLRGLHLAIVDEADSVLIDEARTPLIISETQPDELGEALYQKAIGLAQQLAPGTHYEVSRDKQVYLNPAAEDAVAAWTRGEPGVWQSAVWRRELVHKALTALHCFQRDQHYILAEGKVQIVDEFTGRVMPDRSWERGLHQMIEAKEAVEITGQRKTLAQMTYQRFFRRYLLLGGMTGTAREIQAELRATYDLRVLRVPTHKPGRRQRLADSCFAGDATRWQAVAERAASVAGSGRPVLVGTRSVEASEKLGALLAALGVEHTILNARQDKEEAAAVARAGEPGRITVATNMAGRGTDIKLAPGVDEAGGLHVILTEFHESARVDRQLFGRSARQGNAGSAEAVVALDDELFRRFGGWLLPVVRAFQGRAAQPPRMLVRLLVRLAQARAERYNRRVRLETLKQDKRRQQGMGFAGRDT